jgi:hypothetical protein
MKEHARAQFVEVSEVPSDKLAIGSFGEAGSGKTLLGTSMPPPIGVIPLDRKTRRTIARANEKLGKKIYFPKEDFIRHAKPMEVALMKPEQAMEFYTKHLTAIKDAIFSFAERKDIASVMIDSGTQLWEDIEFAHFGRAQRIMPRDRGPANQEMRDILNALQEKNLLITHQAKEIWRNDKPTGRFEWAGWSKLDYYVNVIIEQTYANKEFGLTVKMCQDAPELIGEKLLVDDLITFDNLAINIYPEWEAA